MIILLCLWKMTMVKHVNIDRWISLSGSLFMNQIHISLLKCPLSYVTLWILNFTFVRVFLTHRWHQSQWRPHCVLGWDWDSPGVLVSQPNETCETWTKTEKTMSRGRQRPCKTSYHNRSHRGWVTATSCQLLSFWVVMCSEALLSSRKFLIQILQTFKIRQRVSGTSEGRPDASHRRWKWRSTVSYLIPQ